MEIVDKTVIEIVVVYETDVVSFVIQNCRSFIIGKHPVILRFQVYHCETCGMDIHGKVNWEAHLKGKKHRKMSQL